MDENIILQVIQDLNIKRLEAEEIEQFEYAERLLNASQTLKDTYL